MFFARVVGRIVATVKDEGARGKKLLLIQPTDHALRPVGGPHVALDAVGVGQGEIVFCESSREAGVAFDGPEIACDVAIVGIVDRVDVAQRTGGRAPR
jgi:ethanolamine utilization protein EutN